MPTLNFAETAVIDASPERVFAAFEDLTWGRAQWWLPRIEVRPRGVRRVEPGEDDLVGAEFDLLARKPTGPPTPMRIVEVQRPALIRYEYLSSVMPGHSVMTLTPEGGRTRVRYEVWWVPKHPLLAPLLRPAVAWSNSRVFMPAFFEGLRTYLLREPGADGRKPVV